MLYKIMFFADAFEASKLSILSARVRIPKTHKYSADIVDLLSASGDMHARRVAHVLLQMDVSRPTPVYGWTLTRCCDACTSCASWSALCLFVRRPLPIYALIPAEIPTDIDLSPPARPSPRLAPRQPRATRAARQPPRLVC